MSITLLLTLITGLTSYQAFSNQILAIRLSHIPYLENRDKQYYRLFSSAFVHADLSHLLFNVIALYSFGNIVEQLYVYEFGDIGGRIRYLLLYFLSVAVANIPSFFKHRDNGYYRAVGASGGVSGIMFAFILFSPWEKICLYFSICIPGIVMGVLYLVYSSYASRNVNDNIGHDAHFYGGVFGFLFTIALQPELFSRFISLLSAGF